MGSRTPDLLIANETLYQLSYTPTEKTSKKFTNASPRVNLQSWKTAYSVK